MTFDSRLSFNLLFLHVIAGLSTVLVLAGQVFGAHHIGLVFLLDIDVVNQLLYVAIAVLGQLLVCPKFLVSQQNQQAHRAYLELI